MSEERSIFADPADALCWLTECTMATIEHMELMRRPPKWELARQQKIVGTALGSLKAAGYSAAKARALLCGRVAKRLS